MKSIVGVCGTGSGINKELMKKLSIEARRDIVEYGYIPSTKVKARSYRNDSSWFRKTFQRPKR